jgi:uncharacterized protein YhbP (UPF0306 family)
MSIDIKARIKEVLGLGHLMSLGTMDDGGPWVADVGYVHDNAFNIYWMSSDQVRHSKAITMNHAAAASIIVGEGALGLQLSGKAEKIESVDPSTEAAYKAKEGRVLPGRSWYVLRPKMIELIDEANFGFKKQKLEL